VEIIRSEGIEDAFVNHAGDGYALGAPDDQDSWIAAVPDPKEPHSILRNISLTNRAISTSADNERSVTLRQARFGHIMDVRRGAPGTQAASMTVLAPSALEADALSTAAFCEPGILASMGGISFLAMRRQENGSLRIEERLNENGNHGIH
jgi:thiamine biosynthesis lipoprotein